MSLDAELSDILREHQGDLLPLARKAYEHGFRQGLAARPAPVVVEPPAPLPPLPQPPRSQPLFAETAPTPDEPDEPDSEEVEDDDPSDLAARPVRSSITVGGLLKKINRHFGLGRFDIEIRVVDPRSHRHLMRGVRLSRYLVEES